MRNPFLIARLVFFSTLIYLSVLSIGFAAWTIHGMTKIGSHVVGPPLFVIINACALFFFLFVALAELFIPHVKTGQVKFECGWTVVMSGLHLAAAVDITINGPPIYCRTEAWIAVCASSTVLAAMSWASNILLTTYFLTLFFTALWHQSTYPGVWAATVYSVPWFIERHLAEGKPQRPTIVIPKQPEAPYENPVFGAHVTDDEEEEEDMADVPLSPPMPPFARSHSNGNRPSPRSSHSGRSCPRSPPSPTKQRGSGRPGWAKRVMTRRGIDPPFTSRPTAPTMSVWSADSSDGPLPPPKPLPRPSHLNGGYLDIPPPHHRSSYAHFPMNVGDPDRPVRNSPLSEWIRADDSSRGIRIHYVPDISPA